MRKIGANICLNVCWSHTKFCVWFRLIAVLKPIFIYSLIIFIMKSTNLSIQFVQGANKLQVSNFVIDSVKINEISGTIANRILTARANMKRYGMKIDGFSFNRKFDIVLSIDGCESVNISDLFGGLFEAKITLQANAKSYERFANIIHDMTFNALTSENRNVVSIGDLQAQKLIG